MSADQAKEWIWEAAKQYGVHTVLLCVAVGVMWTRDEGWRAIREQEIAELRADVSELQTYIRTTLETLVRDNAQAMREFRAELKAG